MTQALTTTSIKTDIMARVNEFQTVAKIFAESGLFNDVKGQAQCFVKILAGAEMGIPPFTAMNSFHIIKGKTCLTANAIAARVKASGRYGFRVIEKTAERCVIEFSENDKPVYTETWDSKRARQAGVQNMDKFPDAMLFARCITAGARAVAPDVVGQFYTPEEMGAQVNAEGDVIQAESDDLATQREADEKGLGNSAQQQARNRAAQRGSTNSAIGDEPFGGTAPPQPPADEDGPPWNIVPVSADNRAGISSLQTSIDAGELASDAKLAKAVPFVKSQLAARSMEESLVKARLAKGATALAFVKLATALMVDYDQTAPVAATDALEPQTA